jgi:hypothetical protein
VAIEPVRRKRPLADPCGPCVISLRFRSDFATLQTGACYDRPLTKPAGSISLSGIHHHRISKIGPKAGGHDRQETNGLTAYVAGVKDVRALDRWIDGAEPYRNAEERLRFTFRVVRTLQNADHPTVIQAWLTGLNPELNDRVPIRLLRDGDLEEVGPEILGAVRAFLAGG